MFNERNAGRKPLIKEEQLLTIEERHNNGESLGKLAEEYGVTRQALYKRLRVKPEPPVMVDWFADGELVTSVKADFKKKELVIANYAAQISKLPFGFNDNPTWQQFINALEEKYLKKMGAAEPGIFLLTEGKKYFSLDEIPDISVRNAEDIPVFEFPKRDLIIARTDTDGFQMKAISDDRRFFIKSQALIAGIGMRDWAVEIIASDIAGQLNIPCVQQHHCRFAFGGRVWDGVYSKNFEIDGYTFVSFETLISIKQLSTTDDLFIKKQSIEKLEWCAEQISDICKIDYEAALKYMLDLAVLDCLTGNVDRHTRNFGVFFDSNKEEYSIPLIFDNGMGLFEHDYYRDNYTSFDDAMHNVYVAPYGEDPFDFLELLNREFHIKKLYKVSDISYPDILNTPFALEYERRMRELWQKLD